MGNGNIKFVILREWWDVVKIKIKSLTMEASKKLTSLKIKIVILELKLENLKNNENNIDVNEKQKLEKEILEFYKNQVEAARLR